MVVWTGPVIITDVIEAKKHRYEELEKKLLALEIKIQNVSKNIDKKLEDNIKNQKELQDILLNVLLKIQSETETETEKKKKDSEYFHFCDQEHDCVRCIQETEDDTLVLHYDNIGEDLYTEIEVKFCPFCGYKAR